MTFYNPKEKNHINFFNKEEIDNSMKDNLDFPIGEILKIETSSNGNLWFSSYDSNGLYLMDVDKKEIISKYLYKESEPYNKNKDYISDILDRGDTIWVATSSNIIKLDRKTGETKYINITKSKENVRISFLKEMSDGKIWIGTDGYGLLIGDIDSNNELTFEVIDHKELRSSSVINVIEYDKFIWITSDKEIYRYQISSGEVLKYSNMLIDIENTFIQHSIEIDGENLLIATKKGLFEMNTEKSFLNIYKPNISLTEILNGKKEIIPNLDGKENKFNYKNNNFKFYFSALDFTNPNSNQYKYKLDGFEENWNYLKSEINMVTYNNLDSGHYTFMVKGTNSSGVWSDDIASFKFKIQSPWWKYAMSFLIFLSCVLIFFMIVSRQKQISNLKFQATRDSLTKVSNRNGFNEYKKESFKKANKNSYAICLLDMDYFKDVNDTMGHDIGDEYLIKIANIIKKTIGEDNHVSRLGGDEFAIIINNFKMIGDLEKLINEIHNNINEVHYINEKIIDGSASIGVSVFTGEETSKSLLKNADIAMYNSKRRGKNKISYFNKNMAQDFFRKNKIKKHLKSGLKFNEFKLNYQPIINKNNGKIESLEALLRWDNKVLGRVSPIDFIPEAEHNGTIVAIGDWVLEEACSQASEWHKLGLLDKYISVNVSPVQMAKGDIESTIVNILDKTGLPPNKLQIEITESIFISNINNTLQIIDNLRAIGVRFALDDFGTGYSSLCYLSKLKLDAIKLDKEFIDDVCTNEMTQKMVKQIVHLSKMMDADLIIEGIETEDQIKALSDFKYQNAQGYYYSKPLVIEDATIILGK